MLQTIFLISCSSLVCTSNSLPSCVFINWSACCIGLPIFQVCNFEWLSDAFVIMAGAVVTTKNGKSKSFSGVIANPPLPVTTNLPDVAFLCGKQLDATATSTSVPIKLVACCCKLFC